MNLTARLEEVASAVDVVLVVSREFAEACPGSFRSLGQFALKGIPRPVDVFVPDG